MALTYYPVQSLIKSVAIMDILADSVEGMGITEISEKTGMNKSTVHRILTTLVHERYVDQDVRKGRYRLSFKLFEIARRILNNVRTTKVVAPFLEKLTEETGESARLIIPDYENARLVVCDEVLTSKPIMVRTHLGETLSLSQTAAGKMFLASLTDEEIKELIDGKGRKVVLEADGYSFSQLRKDLGPVRESGFAYDSIRIEEEKVNNVAAPIQDESGNIVALIDVFWPAHRDKKNMGTQYGKLVRETALEVSRRLGYIPD
jgi:DNA-binding IclR family transcriptional regulator